jgi:hypothetical protein
LDVGKLGFSTVSPSPRSRHGAELNVRTDKVQMMPAAVDIPAYPVKVVDGNLCLLGFPKNKRWSVKPKPLGVNSGRLKLKIKPLGFFDIHDSKILYTCE